MMSTSFAASCLRIANICSCLRMVEAFSTACSLAKARSSVGDLDLRSWSFISRIRGIPKGRPAVFEKNGSAGKGEGKSQVWRGRFLYLIGCPVRSNQKLGYIRLRFRRGGRKYEMTKTSARGRPVALAEGQLSQFRLETPAIITV